MTEVSPARIAADPEWVPHTYDSDGSRLTFVHVPRDRQRELMFLSDDHYHGAYPKREVPAGEVAAALGPAPEKPLHFVFHTAFCCSTLMIKALDLPGRSLGLKEPDVMIHLGNRFARADDAANRQRLGLVLRLLGRPFEAGETVIVKPSNFANRLIEPALALDPRSRALLLWSDLPTFLRSVVRRAIPGRIWARQLYRRHGGWSSLRFGYGPEETFDQTDLQIAGLAWLMQIHHFREVARRLGPERVELVNGADFLARKAETIARASALFGLGFEPKLVENIAEGPVFSRHSKFSQRDYDEAARNRDDRAVEEAHGKEIDPVVQWVGMVADHLRVPTDPRA